MKTDTVKKYVEDLCELTWDFRPTVRVNEIYEGMTFQVYLEGDEGGLQQIMGRHGNTIKAVNKLIQVFCSRNFKGSFVYVYVKPRSKVDTELDKALSDTVKMGTFS